MEDVPHPSGNCYIYSQSSRPSHSGMNIQEAPIVDVSLLECRRQEALSIADRCREILQENFGATQVILFGSLVGDGPWHRDSDIDLAVEGLSYEIWLQAYDKLLSIAPSGWKIDLVRLEAAYPEIRARILQETPMPDNKYLALKERLDLELIALERTVSTLETVLEQAGTISEIFVTPTLASYIADFYMGCEHISERVAVSLDGGLPQGDNWHEALLCQVADRGGDDRPALWSRSLLVQLDEYRRFRHLVHHRYSTELKAESVLALAKLVPPTLANIRQAVRVFKQWLENRADGTSVE